MVKVFGTLGVFGRMAGVAALACISAAVAQDVEPAAEDDLEARVEAYFANVDTDEDGMISKPEFTVQLAKMNPDSPPERTRLVVDRMFLQFDTDADDHISKVEFALFVMRQQGRKDCEDCEPPVAEE